MEDVKRIQLRFDLADLNRRDWPVVTVLVDGEDLVQRSGTTRSFVGFDPEDILGRGSPLLPSDPPRRVAVYRCICGEPGCGVAAPVIAEAGGLVTWSDFRDFTGVFVVPTVDEPFDDEDGKRLPITQVSFDSRQYRDEIARASSDDSWVTPSRRTATLLRERLTQAQTQLAARGQRLMWVSPDWENPDRFEVSLDDAGKQVVIKLAPAAGSAEERAAEMLDVILSSKCGREDSNVQGP